ncbi:hypothetical protein FDECE_17356, partial [Fusarium decemcellulare]
SAIVINHTLTTIGFVGLADFSKTACLEPLIKSGPYELPIVYVSLRVDCNEVGFTESDVRAICKIGKSTKIGHGRSAQYVGEKGIGFKSVFKVSSIVYISSRSFSFKFDRSQAVGLIAPIWAAFPELTLPGSTSFYLKLSDKLRRKPDCP